MNYHYLCHCMTKSFKVAGHVFALTLPDASPLWDSLGQYDPFVVSDGTPIFTLEAVDALPEGDRTLVLDPPVEPGETVIRIFSQGDARVIEMAPNDTAPTTAELWISADCTSARIRLIKETVNASLFSVNNALMLVFAFRTACLDTLEMHASVIKCDGRAFLFLAKSGTGKSTHSSLWLKHVPGSELLNDDNPVVRYYPEDGSVICYGSPWSGKTPCYKNDSAPVGSFVRIRRCAENKIETLDLFNSYALLYSSSSGFKADRAMADGLHATMSALAASVPCRVLDCRPDEEAARVCSEAVL